MKVSGNGQGKILTADELSLLFESGFKSKRDKALFGICLYTACRVSEACALRTSDVDLKSMSLIFRKSTTKGKLKSRIIDIDSALFNLLANYNPKSGYLFPGRVPAAPLTRFMADRILRIACERVRLQGVSTHSFRRTALTMMSSAGIPLRVIQEISGHGDLGTLQRYLEVSQEQKRLAISAIRF